MSDRQLDARRRRDARVGDLLAVLVLVTVVMVGVPQVWQRAATGGFGVEMVFYPVLGIAFGYLALLRRGGR